MVLLDRLLNRIQPALAGRNRLDAAAAIGESLRVVGSGIALKNYFDNLTLADAWKRGFDKQIARDAGVTDPYKQSGPFKRGVDVIAEAVASVPFKLYGRGKGKPDEVT